MFVLGISAVKCRYHANFEERFGNKKLDEISSFDIDSLIIELKKNKRAPKGIKNVIELLNRLYNFAVKRGIYNKNKAS